MIRDIAPVYYHRTLPLFPPSVIAFNKICVVFLLYSLMHSRCACFYALEKRLHIVNYSSKLKQELSKDLES